MGPATQPVSVSAKLFFCIFFFLVKLSLFFSLLTLDHLTVSSICLNQPTTQPQFYFSTILIFFSTFNLMQNYINTVHKHSTSWLCEFILSIN